MRKHIASHSDEKGCGIQRLYGPTIQVNKLRDVANAAGDNLDYILKSSGRSLSVKTPYYPKEHVIENKAMNILIVLLIIVEVCQARYIHPGNFDPDEVLFAQINNEKPDIPINLIRYLKPSRFVPLNSDIFFKSIEPCEDGYQRDVLGICREVWD